MLLIIAKAGVTGLAAIIGSRPFDVPSWLPPILLLAATFVDYPPPLNKIAIKGEWNATPQKKKLQTIVLLLLLQPSTAFGLVIAALGLPFPRLLTRSK